MNITSRDKNSFILILVILIFLMTAFCGCVSKKYRSHPELEIRAKDIKYTKLVPPDIKIYEFTAGGIRELRDDWCDAGKENVIKSINENLKTKSIEIKEITIDKDIEEELEDVKALYRAVSTSILLHTYNPQHIFPNKVNNFDYSLGNIDSILKKYEADSLLFINGIDEISTAGRKALIFAGAVLGVRVRAGITVLDMALIDKSGSVLWYYFKGGEGDYDLREYESCSKLVEDILAVYPINNKAK